MNKILVIIGPTASGKTQLGIDIAKEIDAEIINADSRQIYKFLNIGTAKPPRDKPEDKEFKVEGIIHHMMDFLDPKKQYSAFEFGIESHRIIEDIISRGKIPIVVGGTGLYIDFLTGKRRAVGDSVDFKERERLNKLDIGKLQEIVIYQNKQAYENLNESDRNNPRRLIRLIEKSNNRNKNEELPQKLDRFEPHFIMPKIPNMEVLYERINSRAEKMFEQGFINEVEGLLQMGYKKSDIGLQTMGYIDVINHLENDSFFSYTGLVELTKQKHRNYAKRQMTWFRKYNYTKVSGAKEAIRMYNELILKT